MKSIRSGVAGILMAGGLLLGAGGAVAVAAVDTTGSAAAAPDSYGGHGGHLFSKLGLTSEQEASIKSIMTAARPQMKTLHQQMQANHLKLMQTTPDDPNYSSVVAEVAQSNATLASQRTSQAAEVRAQMYAVLTAAQKTQLATLEAQRAANPPHGRWGAHRQGSAGQGSAGATSTQ